ncbi:hypothetical protein C8R44DRAFT_988619 [Mycena epipterygia]|nr:hypothetical protein C8R44DRAFT_988619 [Mycena epipterygia]
MSLGLFLANYCPSLWQLFLTQALLYGISSSLYYFLITSIAPTYFDRYRGFAMRFLDRYGIRGALLILAARNFAVGILIACVIRRRSRFDPTANGARTRINMGLAKRGTFLYQIIIIYPAPSQAFLSSLTVFALWYDAARECFIAFVVMYGIYAGGYNALIPTTITEIYGGTILA